MATVSLLKGVPVAATCVRISFPKETAAPQEAAFAYGVMYAAPKIVQGGYRGDLHAVAVKLRTRQDAVRLQAKVDGLPVLIAGLGASTTSLVTAAITGCDDNEDLFGQCTSSALAGGPVSRIRCRASGT